MIFSSAFLFCLIIAPLLASLRGWKPAALFFAAAAVYVVFGAISFAQIEVVLSQIREAEPANHKTYYVVSHGNFLWNIGIAIAFAVIGAITWTQTRFGAMRHPTLTKVLFWVLHVAAIGSSSLRQVWAFFVPKPRKYIDYPEFMETNLLINSFFGSLAQIALIGLLCLLLWSVIAKWLPKPN